jgi:hypothetical protein
MYILMSLAVLILAYISYQVGTLIRLQAATQNYLRAALSANLEHIDPNTEESRTILEHMAKALTRTTNKLEEIEGAVAYLRSYFWEVQDSRYLEEIRNPEKSAEWNTRFRSSENPSKYRLWMRERDMSEGFRRHVSDPVFKAKSAGDSEATE